MEQVLEIYKRPYDAIRPLICMDETPRQLIRETRLPQPTAPGRIARYDYEYERCGVCNVFLAVEPLDGRRLVQVTERRTKETTSTPRSTGSSHPKMRPSNSVYTRHLKSDMILG